MTDPRGFKWRCCDAWRKSKFCEDCGTQRPAMTPVTEAVELANEFKAEVEKCTQQAETHERKARALQATKTVRMEPDYDSPFGDFGEVSHMTNQDRSRTRIEQAKAARRRAAKFSRYEAVLRSLISEVKKDA